MDDTISQSKALHNQSETLHSQLKTLHDQSDTLHSRTPEPIRPWTRRLATANVRPALLAAMLLAAGVLATGILVGGCSGSDGDNSGATGPRASDDAASSDESAAEAEAASNGDATTGVTGTADGSVSVVQALAAKHRQVFAATVAVDVDDLRAATREATDTITSLGGFASQESIELGTGGASGDTGTTDGTEHASVTYRVPADEFRTALDALADVGELTQQDVNGEDVTAEYADLDGRVTTLRASISRLQGFLAEATDVSQVSMLEGELTRREAELESIESQRRALADQSELSTITVAFSSGATILARDTTLPSFLGGLEGGWDAAVTAASVALAAAGFVLPFLPIAVVVYLIVRWRGRRPSATQA